MKVECDLFLKIIPFIEKIIQTQSKNMLRCVVLKVLGSLSQCTGRRNTLGYKNG